MERIIKRSISSNKGRSPDDELALVKAAAWAWYERGSGLEGRAAVREFDVALPGKREPKPSRYKLEALKMAKEFQQIQKPSPPLSPWSTVSESETSLLDDYEIGRISKQLDVYIESSRARAEHLRRKSAVLGRGSDRPAHNNNNNSKVASFSEICGANEPKIYKPKNVYKILSRGFWFKYGGICRSRSEDVVVGRSLHGHRKKDVTLGKNSSLSYPHGGGIHSMASQN